MTGVQTCALPIYAVKKSEDGKYIVVRFHEFTGSKQEAVLTTGFPYKAWAECDLRERALTEFGHSDVRMKLHAYEIKTILIEI